MKRIWLWIKNHKKITFAIILFFFFGFLLLKPQDHQNMAYIKAKVFKGDINKVISVTGEVLPKSLMSVNTETKGKIKEIHVKIGDFIKKDQLILTLDAKTQRNNLKTAQSQLNLLKKQKEVRTQHLMLMKKRLKQEKVLFSKKATSRIALEQATEAVSGAEIALEETISAIQQAENNVDTAQNNLNNTEVKAPESGHIVSLPINIGQYVDPTTLLAQITNLDIMQLRMKISENDITQVHVGTPLEYHFFHDINTKYKAKIDEIDPAHTLISQGNYRQEMDIGNQAIYFYTKAFVENKDRHLRLGMTTQNTLLLESKKDLLLVPIIAVHFEQEKPFVQTLDKQGNLKNNPVTLGLSDNKNIEILAGLSEGDEIIISAGDPNTFTDLNKQQ